MRSQPDTIMIQGETMINFRKWTTLVDRTERSVKSTIPTTAPPPTAVSYLSIELAKISISFEFDHQLEKRGDHLREQEKLLNDSGRRRQLMDAGFG